eukprot:m51a1_g6712 putative radical sam domain protein (391) ;mRNA; r:128678-130284
MAVVPHVKTDRRALWFITLTQSCNLRCSYCGSDENFDIEDLSPHPRDLAYDVELLKNLAKENPPPAICFYGGEPLLKTDIMFRTMDMLDESGALFVIQTNGTMLDRVPAERLARVSTILVSLDGDERTTDMNRGDRTYSKAVAELRSARARGFKGDAIARMTVGEWSDIERDVKHLLTIPQDPEKPDGEKLFNHAHWQLDVLWDSPMFARWDNFLGWRDDSYNPGITRLADLFAEELAKGRVLGIAPFKGVLGSILTEEKVKHIRCSAGYTSFNVATGGQVTACPIAPEFHELAKLSPDFDPRSVHASAEIGGRCDKCDVRELCGGRCLYANTTDWWGDEGFAHVCVTVRHLIAEMQRVAPVARKAIADGLITIEQVQYPPFNNSVETIP